MSYHDIIVAAAIAASHEYIFALLPWCGVPYAGLTALDNRTFSHAEWLAALASSIIVEVN
jgi:hypothetical protein